MEKKKNNNRITLDFGGRFHLVLNDTREVMGHDDSLSYNTHFSLFDNVTEVCRGRCWNDGWGGDSDVVLEQGDVPQEMEEYMEQNFHYTYNGKSLGGFKLKDTIDAMAYLYLGNKQTHGKTCPEAVFKKFIE